MNINVLFQVRKPGISEISIQLCVCVFFPFFLNEVERNSFIALPSKGATVG